MADQGLGRAVDVDPGSEPQYQVLEERLRRAVVAVELEVKQSLRREEVFDERLDRDDEHLDVVRASGQDDVATQDANRPLKVLVLEAFNVTRSELNVVSGGEAVGLRVGEALALLLGFLQRSEVDVPVQVVGVLAEPFVEIPNLLRLLSRQREQRLESVSVRLLSPDQIGGEHSSSDADQ